MDVERRGRPSGGQLLDEQELSSGLLGGGLHGDQHPEKPQRLSVLRAECVRRGGSVHKHSPSCRSFPTSIFPAAMMPSKEPWRTCWRAGCFYLPSCRECELSAAQKETRAQSASY